MGDARFGSLHRQRMRDNMLIKHVKLVNWRNFHQVDVALEARMFLIGPNGSGKSNFLDVFRFLRDVAADGLQRAVRHRGGLGALRCLSALPGADVALALQVADAGTVWRYRLVLDQDRHGLPLVKEESVLNNGIELVQRPDRDDRSDPERLCSTSLEQVAANRDFRRLSAFFRSVCYQNLIPQLVRDPSGSPSGVVTRDPFGSDFMLRIQRSPQRSRQMRLQVISAALKHAIPQIATLQLALDKAGNPHLITRSEHWTNIHAVQDERDLSDGTLRLIGLLWSLFEGDGPLLLEEPERSLHSSVVAQLAQIIGRVNRARRMTRQVLISTHSEQLLGDTGIAADEVLVLAPGKDGTAVLQIDPSEKEMIRQGLSVGEVLLPKSAPTNVGQLALAF